MLEPIRSNTNPLIKRVRSAVRGKERGVLVLEGERLVGDAIEAGLVPELVLCSESGRAAELQAAGIEVRLATDSVLASLSDLSTSPGILALLPQPARRAFGADALADPQALVVVAAGIADPGNLGALARTAEAAGASAMLVIDGGCRPWNPKALRGSMGSLLRLPLFEMSDCATAWDALASAEFTHVLAHTRGGQEPGQLDWSGRRALWLTSETGEWPADLTQREAAGGALRVTIPLAPGVESLNVTSAASVLLFAAGRTGAQKHG
jgi:TrmH family RNA methyltransferase